MSNRINKVNQLLQEELAKLIQEGGFEELITVTAVETTPDLKNARVWLSIFSQNQEEVLKKVIERTSYFQSYLGKKLFIKNIPRLSFCIDKSGQRVARIEEILSKS
jgi:ribosome-binding factor A